MISLLVLLEANVAGRFFLSEQTGTKLNFEKEIAMWITSSLAKMASEEHNRLSDLHLMHRKQFLARYSTI
jgi:hypothetical protein